MFSLIMAIIFSNMFKNKYGVRFMQDSKGFFIGFILLWILWGFAPWLAIMGMIVAKHTGILDNMKRRNQNRYNDPNYYKQGYNNPYYNSFSYKNTNQYNTADYTTAKAKNVSNPYNLPRGENGRKKIILRFNDKYNLTLTKQDIQLIASATYMSIEWASEVYSMDRKYDSVYEWLGQGNIWLRVYLYAFNVQNISPVFNKQEELVFQSFDTIFSEMCIDDTLPTEVIIENINHKYLTNFDETSFMLAINYMESRGKRYKYGAPILTRMSSDIENLTRKYN